MNVPIATSAALPPFPPTKKGALPSDAATIIEALGGLKRLRRVRGIAGLAQQGSRRLTGMPNHSNQGDMRSRFATVMPRRTVTPPSHLTAVTSASASMMNALRSSGRPVPFYLGVSTEAIHCGREGTVVRNLSPHHGVCDASQARLPSRPNSFSRLGTPVTATSTKILDVDAMSWCAAGTETSTSLRSRKPYESGGRGVNSQSAVRATRIEETSRPTPDQYSEVVRRVPNVRLRHGLADLAAQTGGVSCWKMHDTSNRESISSNYRDRVQHAAGMGFISGDTDIIVKRGRSTIQPRAIPTNGTATFAGTGDRFAERGIWSFSDSTWNLARSGCPPHEYDCFQEQVTKIPPRPKRGRKRGVPQFSTNRANLGRTAKRPRTKTPLWDTPIPADEMVVCMDIVEETSPQIVPCFPPMEIASSMQEESEAARSRPEPNDSDMSITCESRSCITTPGDDMNDIPDRIEDNGVEEPVMRVRKRSRRSLREADWCDPTEGDVMHGITRWIPEEGNDRKRVCNGFREFGEDDMWEIPNTSEEEYSVQWCEQNAYWGAQEYYPMRQDVMRDLTSESEEDRDPDWDPDATRNAEVYDLTDGEEDMHGITIASVQDVFRWRGQDTGREAEVSDSSDVMHIVSSRSDTDSMEVMHTPERVRILREARFWDSTEQNAFPSWERR